MTLLWGARSTVGGTVRIFSRRESVEAWIRDRVRDERVTGIRIGGPWEVVAAEVEWLPADRLPLSGEGF